jgi:hypothetical protein
MVAVIANHVHATVKPSSKIMIMENQESSYLTSAQNPPMQAASKVLGELWFRCAKAKVHGFKSVDPADVQ